MSSIIATPVVHNHSASTPSYSKVVVKVAAHTIIAMVIAMLVFSSVGCSTTQEFKPTASVIVGGQKSI